ncbi:MAG: carboxymuconolactone decarboxylase family protein [Deltaproteobacteria bacterium]|nr:carboxymuconolactone decarboxylase family protein [Deltaproteobacteria bacterium]
MTMPRIAPLAPPYDAPVADTLAAMMPPGVPPIALFRTLAHNPRILDKVRAGSLLDRGTITRRDRELLILRTTARCGAEYEWGVHVAFFAARVGLDDATVAATVHALGDDDVWAPRDALLIRLADALHDHAAIPDALWTALAAEWSAAQLIELIVLAGSYHTIAFVVNGLRVPLEDGAPRFPRFEEGG